MPHVYQYAAIVGVGRGASGGVGGGVLGGCGGSRGGGIGILPPLHPITSLPIPRPDVPSCSWTGDHRQLRNENADDVSGTFAIFFLFGNKTFNCLCFIHV